MTHPLIPQILDLATPLAAALGLEVVRVIFQTNEQPPILRVDVRNHSQGTGINDCDQMSRALETVLDQVNLIPHAYALEVSSPGVEPYLTSDDDFRAFKGFPVTVQTTAPHAGKQTWNGRLVDRDEAVIRLNQKGRTIAIPRNLIGQVELA